jgi:uncharacterized protein (DUF1810 family)
VPHGSAKLKQLESQLTVYARMLLKAFLHDDIPIYKSRVASLSDSSANAHFMLFWAS